MLSLSCRYALRAAVYLMSQARHATKVGLKDIAKEIEAYEHTTAKILQLLVKEKLIHSAKGPTGGFSMSVQKPVYLIDIVKVVDGVHVFFECGLGLQKCSEKKPCPLHVTYKAFRENLYQEFCTLTIQQLAANLDLGKAYLKRS